MKKLNEAVKNRQPLKVYLEGDYYDTMTFNEKENRYEGQFGNLPLQTISLVLAGEESVDHIKLEVVE